MSKVNGNTLNKWTRNLIKAIVAVAAHQVEQGVLVVEPLESVRPEMSVTLAKYRKGYVTTKKADGSVSVDRGDEVAVALRGMDLGEVLALADLATDSVFGTHLERYEPLNPGQQRMCAGNRIRAAIKTGGKDLGELLVALANASDYESEEE